MIKLGGLISKNPFKKEEITPEVIIEGNMRTFVNNAQKKVKKGGGNDVNLSDSYGLTDVAELLDTNSFGSDIIYTKETLELFKKFVASMTNDEIKNNQPNP